MAKNPWIELLAQEVMPTQEPVYHYTDAGGLCGMIEGRVLWASTATEMNDPAEIVQGLNFIKKWLKKQRKGEVIDQLLRRVAQVRKFGYNGVYLLCGSLDGDDVTQWDRYARGGLGYAVQLDPMMPLAIRDRQEVAPGAPSGFRFDLTAPGVAVSPWVSVLYEDAEKERILEKLLWAVEKRICVTRDDVQDPDQESVRLGAADALWEDVIEQVLTAIPALAQIMKSRGYKGEQEVRVIATTGTARASAFRAGRHGLTEYVELVGSEGHMNLVPKSHILSTLPIVGVTMGPRLSRLNKQTVKNALRSNSLANVATTKSRLQLR